MFFFFSNILLFLFTTGTVFHRGPYSTAGIYPTPAEEAEEAREETREDGRMGRGNICSVVSYAMEL